MSKHTTHLNRNAIQDTLDDHAIVIGFLRPRIVGPKKPAKALDTLFKKTSERQRRIASNRH